MLFQVNYVICLMKSFIVPLQIITKIGTIFNNSVSIIYIFINVHLGYSVEYLLHFPITVLFFILHFLYIIVTNHSKNGRFYQLSLKITLL